MADLLAVVRSAPPDHEVVLPGWTIRTLVVCRQVPLEVSSASLVEASSGCDAVVVTSPRAARWLAERTEATLRQKPILTAGERTASFLEGWRTFVPDGPPGGRSAAQLAAREGLGRLLFLAASETAGTLEAACQELGIQLRHLPVYRTEPREAFASEEIDDLRACRAVAFLAASAVDALVRLRPDLVLELSTRVPAVASGERTLESLRRWGWRDVRSATGPSLAELAVALDQAPLT